MARVRYPPPHSTGPRPRGLAKRRARSPRPCLGVKESALYCAVRVSRANPSDIARLSVSCNVFAKRYIVTVLGHFCALRFVREGRTGRSLGRPPRPALAPPPLLPALAPRKLSTRAPRAHPRIRSPRLGPRSCCPSARLGPRSHRPALAGLTVSRAPVSRRRRRPTHRRRFYPSSMLDIRQALRSPLGPGRWLAPSTSPGASGHLPARISLACWTFREG